MELELIKWLRTESGMELLGDDAVEFDGKIFTVDMLTEGIDFILSETDPELIGRKSLAVNLSDIAAMGAVPEAALIAISLPHNNSNKNLSLAKKLYSGMKPLLEKYNVKIIGGDTNCWNNGLVVSITVIGSILPKGVFKRSGAKSGDTIFTTGELGGSILKHQFLFEPRIFEAIYLNENYSIHAAIDISDGLAIDLHRIANESKLGATLYSELIPISQDAIICSKTSGRPPINHALADGEDFELILAIPQEETKKIIETQPLLNRFGTKLFPIGKFTDNHEMIIVNPDGTTNTLKPIGFEHK
ncbi:MAG: thiamine-phosphate kinase [Planctomycetaceae bacterium]|jgi:thiamine-monophosphate kinase|nr:thiamine-phosphate kinase [Planctomycetaceae bacterium]